ncbi:MAG: GxxExxY protein [Acidobacteriota bacterium]|nr:MAG: GxxExxY protein [Acidobacteriota bacterium]
MNDKLVHSDLSYKIIGLAMQVHRELGHGFLEKVYENALMVALAENNMPAQQQYPIRVSFHGKTVGDYFADIVVEGSVILELKAQEKIVSAHRAQTLNYLKATDFRLALLFNFGKRSLEYERFVY